MQEAIFQEIRAKPASLIMLLHRRFPEETGSFPESHFHLDGEHTSITCTHKHVSPLSSVLGPDGYTISLLEPDMEHVFMVYTCLSRRCQ